MELEAISHYLEEQGVGKQGVDVFITEMPIECTDGILLLNRYAGSTRDRELPGFRDTGFRVIVRSREYARGRRLARDIGRKLKIEQPKNIGKGDFYIYVKQMEAVTDPLPYRRSDGSGIWEFEIDMVCIYIIE